MTDDKRLFQRTPDGGYRMSLLTEDAIPKRAQALVNSGTVQGLEEYALSMDILIGFFGLQWAERHVMDESAPRGFLNRFDEGEQYETTIRRLTNLAEMLVNLQRTKGVEACFDQLAGGKLESAFAELEAGMVLRFCQVPFRFIWPGDKRGESFDIELMFHDGQLGCADVKSKSGKTVPSEGTIVDSLNEARRQLPRDHPGVIILKLPVRWLREPEAGKKAADGTRRFLRQTGRVIAVLVIYSDDVFTDPQVHTWHHVLEIPNDRHRFDANKNWRIVRVEPSKPEDWIVLRDALAKALTSKR